MRNKADKWAILYLLTFLNDRVSIYELETLLYLLDWKSALEYDCLITGFDWSKDVVSINIKHLNGKRPFNMPCAKNDIAYILHDLKSYGVKFNRPRLCDVGQVYIQSLSPNNISNKLLTHQQRICEFIIFTWNRGYRYDKLFRLAAATWPLMKSDVNSDISLINYARQYRPHYLNYPDQYDAEL